ncbi:MAG TPA: DUF4214 domain-containing protein [Gemmataceae bacterium]|nr:DUF4214 domain-containing protein [Gemmataceae bacterium]
MARRRARRSVRISVEVLEERCNPSSPAALPGSPYTLPGANSVWSLGNGPFYSSAVTANLDGDGLQEVLTPGGNGNLYAYKYNAANGQMFIDHVYSTGTLAAQIESTPVVTNLPSGPAVFVGLVNGWVIGWDARTGNVLPGWPQLVPAGNTNSGVSIFGGLAAGNLDGTGIPDIVVPSVSHEVTAYRANGTMLWEYNNDDTVFSGAAIGDLNNDGKLEVIIGGDAHSTPVGVPEGTIICLSADGKPEWVKLTNQVIWSSPALADLQGNGKLDVVVGTGYFYPRNPDGSPGGPPYVGNTVYALDSQGNDLPGWPYTTTSASIDGRTFSSPAIADLTGNGSLDVVIADGHGDVIAIQPNGQTLWNVQPFQAQNLYSSPIVADVTGSGKPDVIIAGAPKIVALDGATGTMVWSDVDNLPHYSGAAVGQFEGGSSYQLAVIDEGISSGSILAPSYLSVFNLGNSTLVPPWPQYHQGEGNESVTRSVAYCTTLIDELFTNALHRSITAFELNSIWLPDFEHAPSLQPLIDSILGSQEARGDQIESWYQSYLNRQGDSGGVQAWQNFLASGQSYASAQAQFAGSPEAYNDAGGTNAGWVTYLYQKILNRNPAQSEVALWVNQLNSGAITRPQIALEFLLSVEMTNDNVIRWYQEYQPNGLTSPRVDDLEAMAWDLRRGLTEESALGNMITAQGDYVTTQVEGSWLRTIYNDILQRPISPQETVFWLQQIERGMALSSIASAITHSTEYYTVLVADWYQKYLGRAENPGEGTQFVNDLINGGRQIDIIDIFMQSDEFYNHTGGNNTGYVNAVYEDLLGRAPNSGDMSTWVNNPNVRSALPALILSGAPNEFFQNMVNGYYMTLLRRLASTPSDHSVLIPVGPFGGQVWVNDLLGGSNPVDVLAAIATSQEYFDVVIYKSLWLGARWP